MPPPSPDLAPTRLAPYFTVAALVHAAAVASRFDVLAAQLPDSAPLAIMLAQFPLLFLSGYVESRLLYSRDSGPRWMRIDSTAVKAAFAFGFMYLVVVVAQTWDLKVGPANPNPPATFSTEIRALWFSMFTLGFTFLFYMAAASVLIPILRVLTYPLRYVPTAIGAVLAVALGGAVGIVVLAAVQSTRIAAFIRGIKTAIQADPALMIGVTFALALGPLLLAGLLGALRRRDPE